MKLNLSVLSALFFLTAHVVLAAEHDHGEHRGESCACAAAEEDFTINCANQAGMSVALAALAANSCDQDCSSEICHKNFLIVLSHHDYCLPNELPATLEDGLHFFETGCDISCSIKPRRDESLPDCVPAACDDSGNQAHLALLANSCDTDCSSDLCGDQYRTLLYVHDECGENVLSDAAETTFHNFEELCHRIHGCNIPLHDGDEDPLHCDELDAPDVGAQNSGSVSTSVGTVGVLAGASAAMLAL